MSTLNDAADKVDTLDPIAFFVQKAASVPGLARELADRLYATTLDSGGGAFLPDHELLNWILEKRYPIFVSQLVILWRFAQGLPAEGRDEAIHAEVHRMASEYHNTLRQYAIEDAIEAAAAVS